MALPLFAVPFSYKGGGRAPKADSEEMKNSPSNKTGVVLEVQTEVYKKLLTGEEQHKQKQAKVKCRCARANRFKGKGVVEYAKRHLKLTGTTSSGTRIHYICPETGKKWTREGYTLTAYQDKPKQ